MHRLQTLDESRTVSLGLPKERDDRWSVPTVMGSWRFNTLAHRTSINNGATGVLEKVLRDGIIQRHGTLDDDDE